MEKLLVVKIGGNIIDNNQALDKFLIDFASLPLPKILVHGGGKLATELSQRLGIVTNIVEGRRITDLETIKVVTMTYAGWINKNITARLQALNCNAIGLCGADAKLLPAVKRPVKEIDYGLVGDLDYENVNATLLANFLSIACTPVIAPVTANATGDLLNVNADTVAQALAQALSSFYNTTLIYCFEKKGLLADVNNNDSVIAEVNKLNADLLKQQGVIAQGMIPKIDNAVNAIEKGVQKVIIGHAAFIKEMAEEQKGYGTYIRI